MYTKNKKWEKNMQQSPDDNILSRQGKIKMLTRREKKIGGLGGWDMVYRSAFSMRVKSLFKNGSREYFRIFYVIYSSF